MEILTFLLIIELFLFENDGLPMSLDSERFSPMDSDEFTNRKNWDIQNAFGSNSFTSPDTFGMNEYAPHNYNSPLPVKTKSLEASESSLLYNDNLLNPSEDSFNNDPFKSGLPFATLLHDEPFFGTEGDISSHKQNANKYSMLTSLIQSTNHHPPLTNESSSSVGVTNWFATDAADDKDSTYF